MPHIQGTSQEYNYNPQNNSSSQKTSNFNTEEIDFLFSTEDVELKRTDFDSTFEIIDSQLKAVGGDLDLSEPNNQAMVFYQSLVDNRSELCEKLGISEEKYDSLSCVALALASQETGMGSEDFSLNGAIKQIINKDIPDIGYQNENTWAKEIRDNLKGDDAASSGLTQMKIHNFIQDENLKGILQNFGVVSSSKTDNNLYLEPDKAAIATVVVLNELNKGYDSYLNTLEESHKMFDEKISSDEAVLALAEEEGNNILDKISTKFCTLKPKEQSKLRNALKNVLEAENDTKFNSIFTKDKKYNEEYQMNKLNKLLKKMDIPVEITVENLDNIRYALTAEGQEMNRTEYLAYAWNKGTGESGMKLDRMLMAKIGTILSSKNTFDGDQFESNVANLTKKYANQAVDENGLEKIDFLFATKDVEIERDDFDSTFTSIELDPKLKANGGVSPELDPESKAVGKNGLDIFNIEKIDFLFATKDVEIVRTDFDSTFTSIELYPKLKANDGFSPELDLSDPNNQAITFYNSLLKEKSALSHVLRISEDEYDALACVALALASQETGMGSENFSLNGMIKEHEIGYQNENTGVGKKLRDYLINKKGKTASSGLTQMKIHDFMQNEKLNRILSKFGVTSNSTTDNNLYLEPDKAAIATVVVLNELNKGYVSYIDKMEEKNKSLEKDFTQKNLNLSDVEEEGKNILNTLSKEFEKLNIEEQKEITKAFINVMYAMTPQEIEERAKEGEKDSEEEEEEIPKEEDMINTMNNLLTEYGINIQLSSENLNYIRYFLIQPENRLNRTEFLAHTWNKGSSGEKEDAYLSVRIRTLLNVENRFDDSQYVSSVANLTEKYVSQAVSKNGLDVVNEFLA